MTEVEIRERDDGDLPECVRALRLVHEADGYPMVWPADPSGWLSPDDQAAAWVAVTGAAAVASGAAEGEEGGGHRAGPRAQGGEILGQVLLREHPEPDCYELARLFVAPAARGLGLGAALMKRAETWAARRGCRLVLEVVADERSGAIALYEKAGWRRTSTVVADWSAPDGTPVRLHRYALGTGL
jgi:GNAT superfamily N-acetyltransferase